MKLKKRKAHGHKNCTATSLLCYFLLYELYSIIVYNGVLEKKLNDERISLAL